jgi:hypothetical protein
VLHLILLILSVDLKAIFLWPLAVLLSIVAGLWVEDIIALSALLARLLAFNTLTFLNVHFIFFEFVLSGRAFRLALVFFLVEVTSGVTARCAQVSVSWEGWSVAILVLIVLANALPAACCTI